jgi:hypothetical protein
MGFNSAFKVLSTEEGFDSVRKQIWLDWDCLKFCKKKEKSPYTGDDNIISTAVSGILF